MRDLKTAGSKVRILLLYIIEMISELMLVTAVHTFDFILGHTAAQTAGKVAGDVGGSEQEKEKKELATTWERSL